MKGGYDYAVNGGSQRYRPSRVESCAICKRDVYLGLVMRGKNEGTFRRTELSGHKHRCRP